MRVLGLVDARYSKEERGDLLIFVSGAAEISAVADACAEYAQQNGGWLVLPLHSGLAAAQQQKVRTAILDPTSNNARCSERTSRCVLPDTCAFSRAHGCLQLF